MTAKTARAHGKVHTWPPLPAPPRDPKVDPIFGDVFEIETGKRTYRAMFVNSVANGEWRGVQLAVIDGPPLGFIDTGELRIFVTTAKWTFIETIDGHATGGYTPGGPFDKTGKDYDEIRTWLKGLSSITKITDPGS